MAIPLVFGIQQLLEGFIWIKPSPPHVTEFLTYCYLTLAYLIWPLFLPFAVGLIESNSARRKSIQFLLFPSGISAIFFAIQLMSHPISHRVTHEHIEYIFESAHSDLIQLFYCAGTLLPCLISSNRWLQVIGIAILGSFIVSQILFQDVFASVWCFFAAIISGLLCFRANEPFDHKMPSGN